jgi:hypothetical protein
MRKTTLLICLLGIFLVSCSTTPDKSVLALDCLPLNLQSDIIAFYPFSNGSINDLSGNGHHLENVTLASPGSDRTGNSNCAFQFNNVYDQQWNPINDEHLFLPNPTFLNNLYSSPFSISLWHRTDVTGGVIMFRGTEILNCMSEWFLDLSNNNIPRFSVNNQTWFPINNHYATGEWHNLVVTYNLSELRLYQDAVLLTTFQMNSCNTPNTNAGDLFIGKHFKGTIDDIIIYSRELIPSEVETLYNLQPCCY